MAYGPPYVVKLTKVAFGPADGTMKYAKVFDFNFMPVEADVFDNNIQVPLTMREKPRVGAVVPGFEFSMHIAGSASAGTAPPDQDLLKACALSETIVADTSVTYATDGKLNLSDDTGAGDLTAADVYAYLGDGFKCGMEEAVADAVFEFVAGQPAKVTYRITGQYVVPTEAGSAEDAWGAATPVVSKGLTATIKAEVVPIRMMRIALNNEVVAERDLSAGAVQGIVVPRLADQAPTIEVEFRLPLQSAIDPFALFIAETSIPFILTLGSTAGNIGSYTISGFQKIPPVLYEQDGYVYCRMLCEMDSANKYQAIWT